MSDAERPPEQIGILEDFIQQKFRAGIYQIKLYDSQGQFITSSQGIEIADPPRLERPVDHPAIAPASVTAGFSQSDLVEFMRAESNRNHALLMEFVRTRSAEGNSIKDLIAALAALKQITPAAPPPPPSLDQVFLKGVEFASKVAAPAAAGDSEKGLMDYVKEIYELARPMVAEGLAALRQPPAAPAAEETETELDIEPALEFLKDKARQGRSVEWCAETIIDQMQGNADLTNLIVHTVNQPVDEFLALDDAFAADPLKSWIINLHAELHRRLIPAAPAAFPPLAEG